MRSTPCCLSWILFLIWLPSASWGQTIPIEPNDQFLVNEEVYVITGLSIRDSSLSQDGVVDDRTARHILHVAHNDHDNTVVDTLPNPL